MERAARPVHILLKVTWVFAAMLVMQTGVVHLGVPAAFGASRGCPTFTAMRQLQTAGHPRAFDDRFYDIGTRGVGCAEAHLLIMRAERVLSSEGMGFGVFVAVGGWRCTSFRPFAGSAGFIHWDSVCRRGGGRELTWSERTLSSSPTAQTPVRPAQPPKKPKP
jgi:hypothetical protein